MVNCSHASPAIADYIDATIVAQEHATKCIKDANCYLDSTSTYCISTSACPEGLILYI